MDQQQLLMMLPDLQADELTILLDLSRNMNETQKQQFLMLYRNKRKDRQTMLLLAAIGFLGIAGIHRFIIGDIGLGVLYIFTLGFCFIGTIIDIVNISQLTSEFNRKQALESAGLVRMLSGL